MPGFALAYTLAHTHIDTPPPSSSHPLATVLCSDEFSLSVAHLRRALERVSGESLWIGGRSLKLVFLLPVLETYHSITIDLLN